MKPKRPVWNYREMLSRLGGDQDIADFITAKGFDPPPLSTIKGWRFRDSISGTWGPLIVIIAMEAGILPSLQALAKQESPTNG